MVLKFLNEFAVELATAAVFGDDYKILHLGPVRMPLWDRPLLTDINH